MKKYYIVEFGKVVSTATFLGEYEEIWDAKDDAFGKMGDSDMLVGFPADFETEYTDEYGYNTVKWEEADEAERTRLLKTDDSMEGVPAGLYYWEDDTQDTTYYNADGTKWDN